jgi:hypothetical protein
MGMSCCFEFRITECGSVDIDYWQEVGGVKPPGNATALMPLVPRVSGLMRLVIANDWD